MLEQWVLSGLNLWILIGLVVALFGIAFIICMLPVRKTGGSFFRKYAFEYLIKYSVWIAVILSAVIFAVLHFEITLVMCVFFLGIILALYIKNGYPVIFTMIVHFSNNLSGLVLQSSGENVIYFLNKYFCLFAVLSICIIIFTFKRKPQ